MADCKKALLYFSIWNDPHLNGFQVFGRESVMFNTFQISKTC